MQLPCFSDIASRINEMHSTVDWMEEMSTTIQMETNRSDDMIAQVAPALKSSSWINNVANIASITAGVAGILTNAVVLLGFCVAGRSKMNVSSAYIANHTTLEQKKTFKPSSLTDIPVTYWQTVSQQAVEEHTSSTC